MTDTGRWVAAGAEEMDTSTHPCSPQLSVHTSLVCSYWQRIRIGSLHLALSEADQSCRCRGGLRGPRPATACEARYESVQLYSPCLCGAEGVDGLIRQLASPITAIDHLTREWTVGSCRRKMCVMEEIVWLRREFGDPGDSRVSESLNLFCHGFKIA